MRSDIPLHWARAKFGDVVDVCDYEREPINSSQRQDRIADKSPSLLFPYFGATGQVGWIDDYRSDGERILLGEDGAPFLDPTRDKAYRVSGKFWVNNHAHVLQGAAGCIDNRFLCYQLNIIDYRPFVSGSTRLKLTTAAMKQISLVIAPADEQTRIVAKLEELLSDLDAGVAELKTAHKKLTQYRQSLLKAAVEGVLTAEWRKQNKPKETGAQLLERILKERRASWEQNQFAKFNEQGKVLPKGWQGKYPEPANVNIADLPTLPEGWVWTSLDALILDGPQNGLYLPATAYGRGCPILRIDDFQNGWSRSRDELKRVEIDTSTRETYSLRKQNLVINRVNSMTHLGKSMIVGDDLVGTIFESNMMRATLSEVVNARYVGLYLGSELGRKRLVRGAKWAVNQASINQQDVKRTPVPLAPVEEQDTVVDMALLGLNEADMQAAAIAAGLELCRAQRKNILKAAFSGQLVPQDSNDEPASVLLERIRTERLAKAQATTKRAVRKRA